MATEIKVPELGESVSEARVGRWLKKKGQRVQRGEAVVELETDKVDLEVGADDEGVLSSIDQEEGTEVQVGDVLGRIEPGEAQEEVPSAGEDQETEEPAAGKDEEVRKAAQEKGRAEPEEREAGDADKTEAESEKKEAGPRKRTGAPAEKTKREKREPAEAEDEPAPSRPTADERATPTAKRVAEEAGVDLDTIDGSGDRGRITKRDVERSIADRRRPDAEPEPDRHEERIPMSSRRRTIARRLVEAQRTAAMLTTFNEVDMGALQDLRSRYAQELEEEHDVRLGVASFFIKATIGALKKYPRLNAELDGEEIVLKHYYDIGIAVGASEGLVVPVIRDADKKSVIELEKTVKALARKANENELTASDLQGGTFTITNGGVFGSLLSTPILNPPQVGILGLHKIEQRPYVVDGEVQVRPLMYVALSYDHRLVDGREAVQFLVRLKTLVEDPERLVIES